MNLREASEKARWYIGMMRPIYASTPNKRQDIRESALKLKDYCIMTDSNKRAELFNYIDKDIVVLQTR